MVSIDFTDPKFYRMKPDPTAVVDNVFSSLAAPSIMLGFLDTAGKNDAASLRNAIQATDNAGNARERASLDSLSQSERELAGQVHQQQQTKYAADSNARMQLLQKSNEIAGQINDIYKNYDYTTNPHKYINALNELTRQKEEIDAQMETATQAVVNNPMNQGETLVNPVSVAKSPLTAMPTEIQGEIDTAAKFLGERFASMTEAQLDKTTPDVLYKELKNQVNGLQMSQSEFNSIYKDYYEHYKNPHNRAADTLKRNISVSTDVQKYQITKLENQVALAQALAGAQNLENAQAMMKSLGIKEGSPFWNFGVQNYGNTALQFLGQAAIKMKEKDEQTQPPEPQKIDGLGGLKIVPKK